MAYEPRGRAAVFALAAVAAVAIIMVGGALPLLAPSGAPHIAMADTDDVLQNAYVTMNEKVYGWTDKVYITILAPDYNFDKRAVDSIGDRHNTVKIYTRNAELDEYRLVETGPNTGIFKGEVTLIGFDHDADGSLLTGTLNGYDNPARKTGGNGPTGGYLGAGRDDAVTVSFEYTEDHTVIETAPIRWNVGEIQWSKVSYPESATGVIRVVDRDMNLGPERIDNFEIDVWSDSDPVGVSLVVTESSESSGIFEGEVVFTSTEQSSGHRLRAAAGDMVTASYEDNTLPKPYGVNDEHEVAASAFIDSVVDPLDRISVSGPRLIDSLGTDVGNNISVGQQVQVTSTLTNMQPSDQSFVYIVMIRDGGGRAVSLSWIDGDLWPDQSFNAATSWIAGAPGTYYVDAFVWESIRMPDALANPAQATITVN